MILITGATGTNGVELINQLAAMGEPCCALVRDPQEAATLLPADTQIFRGDLSDRASLDEAMSDVEKVFLLCPVHPKQVEWEANVIDAALKPPMPGISARKSTIPSSVSTFRFLKPRSRTGSSGTRILSGRIRKRGFSPRSAVRIRAMFASSNGTQTSKSSVTIDDP